MKKIILLLTLILISTNAVFAERIPVKITPAQDISTVYNEVQIYDPLKFKIENDVYYNKKILIKKDTYIIGTVDYVMENGWAYDNALIQIKDFKTKDVNDNLVQINSSITLDGFELLKTKGKRFPQFFNYIGVIVRGKEVDIKNGVDKPVFTIWLSK